MHSASLLITAFLLLQEASSIDPAAKALHAGRPAEAKAMLLPLVRQQPANTAAWNLLGIAEAQLNDPGAAKDAFLQALRLDPRFLPANENVGLLLFSQKNYPQAARFLEQALQVGSTNSAVRFNLGVSLLRSGKPALALKQFQQLGAPFTNSALYWKELGVAEFEVRAFQQASEDLSKSLSLEPENADTLNEAARAAEGLGETDKAVSYLVKARGIAPNDVPTLLHFGRVCLIRGLDQDALSALSQAYEAEPGNNEALYLLAGAHLALLHYKQARALVAEFCARVPNYATAHYALGWIDEKLGQDGLAQSEFQACLKLEPSFQGAITELGEMALHSNRLDEAEGRFRRVLALNPGNAKVAVGLGDVLRKRGYIEAALKQYEAAARKDPNWSVPHYRLALLLSRKGDKTEGDSERKIAQSLAKKEVTEGSARLTILWPELAGEGQQALQAPAAISASE